MRTYFYMINVHTQTHRLTQYPIRLSVFLLRPCGAHSTHTCNVRSVIDIPIYSWKRTASTPVYAKRRRNRKKEKTNTYIRKLALIVVAGDARKRLSRLNRRCDTLLALVSFVYTTELILPVNVVFFFFILISERAIWYELRCVCVCVCEDGVCYR